MGWRFRRSVQLIPGVRINLSRSGISTSVGVKGAHVTFGGKRITRTVGIPGTGISFSSSTSLRQTSSAAAPAGSWRGICAVLGILSLFGAVGFYVIEAKGLGNALLYLAFLTAVPFILQLVGRLRTKPEALVPTRQLEPMPEWVPGKHAAAAAAAPRVEVDAERIRRLQLEHQERLRRLDAERSVREAEEAATAARLRMLQDKLRVLLFLARDDGVVRAKERDVMVAYLRLQPGLEEANDAWLKSMHAKIARDSDEAAVEAVARLGSAGEIDGALILASEGLTKLTKRISPAQLNVLTMLRHERARGPWRPAAARLNNDDA